MSASTPNVILAVSRQRALLRRLADVLGVFHYEVVTSADPTACAAYASLIRPQVCLVDAEDWPEVRQELATLRPGVGGTAPMIVIVLADTLSPATLCEVLDAGADDIVRLPLSHAELLSRLRAAVRVSELDRRLAEIDPLDAATGLLSQAGLLARERSGQAPAAVAAALLLELDLYEQRVQHFGLAACQPTLVRTAELIRQTAQPRAALAAHLGHGRFAVVLPRTGLDEAQACAEQLRSALADATQAKPSFTCSLGVAAGASAEAGLSDLLARGRQALQTAQANGRNCVAVEHDFSEERGRWHECVARGNPFAGNLARDVMTPFSLWLTPRDSARQLYEVFARTGLPLIPVMQARGQLAGIVLAEQLAGIAAPPDAEARATVNDWLTDRFLRLPADAEHESVMRHFFERNREPVVIFEQERALGYITFQNFARVASGVSKNSFHPLEGAVGCRKLLVPDVVRPAASSCGVPRDDLAKNHLESESEAT